jgi:proline dehydrogenase
MIARSVLLQMAGNKSLEAFARHNPLATNMAHRFVAGETLDQITEPVRVLNRLGLTASLDYLGESVTTQEEVAEVLDTHLRLFQHIREQKLDANVSIKLTSIGLDIDAESCYRNMLRLLNAAGPDQFVRIDMEGTRHTQITLDLFYRLWEGQEPHKNVGIVIQAYLRRSEADIEKLITSGVRVRLCKGAYQEPPELAYQDKDEVDANYVRLMQRLLKDGNYPGIATHDSRMIEATQEFARLNNIPTARYEFQMLYGVRRDLQVQLKRDGYNMRVYTPFGTHWYPYMMRRMAERPANLMFALRSMTGK